MTLSGLLEDSADFVVFKLSVLTDGTVAEIVAAVSLHEPRVGPHMRALRLFLADVADGRRSIGATNWRINRGTGVVSGRAFVTSTLLWLSHFEQEALRSFTDSLRSLIVNNRRL